MVVADVADVVPPEELLLEPELQAATSRPVAASTPAARSLRRHGRRRATKEISFRFLGSDVSQALAALRS
jgi:hypothetical protein